MFDRNLMKLQGMGGVLPALVIFALLKAAAIAGQAFGLASAISGLWAGGSLGDQASSIVLFIACFATSQLIAFARDTMLDRFASSRASELRMQLIERIFSADDMLASRIGAGQAATSVTQGIDDIETYIRIVPPKIIEMIAVCIPLLVYEFTLDWPSGIILLVMFPVIIFFMILLGKQARSRAERQYEAYNRLSNRFLDTLRGLHVIVASGAGKTESDAVYRFSEKLRTATIGTLTTATLSSAVLDLIATFGVAAVAMMLAFRLMDESIALQVALAALIIAPEYFAPIRAFAGDFHASLDGKNALASVLALLHDADELPDSSPVHVEPGPSAPSAGDVSEPRIAFEDVSFSYPGSKQGALHDLTFDLEGPSFVGIVGASGAGKSTVAALAAGFLKPTSGHVRLQGHVRFVPQNPYLFKASLAYNVSLYNPGATREEVLEALHAVGLDPLVASLADGIDTVLGDGARPLSGGQAQRISIARMILDHEARIVIFDEPTAHLDIETEYELKEKLIGLLDDKLVLFSTHRMHWLAQMDHVIVLDEGRVAERGNPAELLAAKGALAELAQALAGGDVA